MTLFSKNDTGIAKVRVRKYSMEGNENPSDISYSVKIQIISATRMLKYITSHSIDTGPIFLLPWPVCLFFFFFFFYIYIKTTKITC